MHALCGMGACSEFRFQFPDGLGTRQARSVGSRASTEFPCPKWELTCLPPWVAKEKMGTLLLASEMPIPIPR